MTVIIKKSLDILNKNLRGKDMNTPNKLTIARMILVPIIVIISMINIPGMVYQIPVGYLIIDILFIIASITDKIVIYSPNLSCLDFLKNGFNDFSKSLFGSFLVKLDIIFCILKIVFGSILKSLELLFVFSLLLLLLPKHS